MSAVLPLPVLRAPRQRAHWTNRIAHLTLLVITAGLLVFLGAPLLAILGQASQDAQGRAVGVGNFIHYLTTPALLQSLWNSIWVSLLVTLIVLPLAFTFAYALTRSCMPAKGLFRTISLVPLLAPSLLSAISLIYWFGNQGSARAIVNFFGIENIYGATGIVMAECFAVFPHALMILIAGLSLADARLYDAADALVTRRVRRFFTITLPGAK